MTFLNPAVLFGLFAAAIPIVLHFLNLRKLKRIEFSTLVFLKELQKTKIRRIKLKQWLLLLIRVMIVILMVMTFARPVIKSVSFGSSSTAKTSAIIIIDNTFSMSVLTERGSYFNRAKQIAKNLLGNFQQGDEITILPLAELNTQAETPTTNFSGARKRIEQSEISQVSRTINEALIRATQILYQSNNFNKEIYLLTDFQKGRLFNTPKELSGFGKILSPETRLYCFDLGSKEAVNLGIEELHPANQIFEKGKTISFSVRVKNYSHQSVDNTVVSLFVNGKRSAQQNISIDGNASQDISFETTLQDTGLVEFSAELEDDDILQDNKRYWSVHVPETISLLLLTDKQDDDRFIKLALGIPNKKIELTEQNTSQIASLNLKKYDAVMLIGTERFILGKILMDYLTSGKNVLVFPGSQNTALSFQNFLNSVGLSNSVSFIGKTGETETISEFRFVDFQHPLFKTIFESGAKTQLESPDIFAYFKITGTNPGKNIISLTDNSSFLNEYKIGNGKLLLFNSAPSIGWNTMPLKAFFAPLINNTLLYCSVKLPADSTYMCGHEITADISGTPNKQIQIIRPDNSKEYLDTDSLSNKNFLRYTETTVSGTYRFCSGSKGLDNISVNFDPRESVTDKFSETDFENYLNQVGFKGKLIQLSSEDDYLKSVYQSRFGAELWKYFLILVMILAVVESILAKSSKKDLIT